MIVRNMKNNDKIKQNILIDLDGVLCSCEGGYDENCIPKIKAGAKEFLKKLYYLRRFNLILFTSRNLLKPSKWLIDNDLYKYFQDITNIKIPVSIY